MAHYVCTGNCKGVSEYQGYCQTAGCPNYGQELKNCDCEDNRHQAIFGAGDESGDESPEMV